MANRPRIEYGKRKGYRLHGTAQLLGQEIEGIRRKAGHLTPHLLVERAFDPASPLHDEFEWDDTEAAKQYRIEQARYLLQAIVIIRQPTNGDPALVRAFVHLNDEADGPIYTSIAVAMGDAVMRNQVLERAWRELEGWRQRYAEYEELAAIFNAIEEQRKAS